MRCEDLMRRPVEFIPPSQSVQAVARKMRDANIGFLPICDAEGRVLGTITDRDLATRILAADHPDVMTEVSEVMTHDLVACRPTDEISQAEELMARHQKSRLLVTDDHGRLVGVISLSDLAGTGEPLAAETLRAVASREVLDPHGRKAAEGAPPR